MCVYVCMHVYVCVCAYLDNNSVGARALSASIQRLQQSLVAFFILLHAPSSHPTYDVAVLRTQAVGRCQFGEPYCECAGPVFAFACVCVCVV